MSFPFHSTARAPGRNATASSVADRLLARVNCDMAIPSPVPTARLCNGSIGKTRAFSQPYRSHRDGRHRGCVTPQMLGNMASYGVERIAGFSGLRTEDKARVRLALKKRRLKPADVTGATPSLPPTSQPSQVTATQPPAPSTQKRKADTAPGPSRVQNVVAPSPTQAAARQAAIGGAAWEEGAETEDVADQQIDELYCTLSSNVVGIQYYKGACLSY
jgi:SWI/SNF-related matrix-associated actin-dependent regulator of chromatin subfamily A3